MLGWMNLQISSAPTTAPRRAAAPLTTTSPNVCGLTGGRFAPGCPRTIRARAGQLWPAVRARELHGLFSVAHAKLAPGSERRGCGLREARSRALLLGRPRARRQRAAAMVDTVDAGSCEIS